MQDNQEESVEQLYVYRVKFERERKFNEFRKNRIAQLMIRRSAEKWSQAKREKMVRRHSEALKQFEQSMKMLDQIDFRLTQLTQA